MTDEWETKITKVTPNELLIRGYPLDDLIGSITFASGIFLIIRGELPSLAEEKVINAILVSSIDHGVTAPSAVAARTVASCGVPITTAIGAGILAIGDYHGGAGERCFKFLKECLQNRKNGQSLQELAAITVQTVREQKIRIPGFGHRYHSQDPRTIKLLKIADQEKISGVYVNFAQILAKELSDQSQKPLPLNVDGTIGAILADMGFEASTAKAFFAISRIAGLTAHILEEYTQRPVRTIIPSEAKYTGNTKRRLP